MTSETVRLRSLTASGNPGLWVEHWCYGPGSSAGPDRPCHAIYLNHEGARYDGRIADTQVHCAGSRDSIAVVPAGSDCRLQIHAPQVDVYALCIEPASLSAFALKSGLSTAGFHERVDDDATMHHLSRALLSAMNDTAPASALVCDAVSQGILAHMLGRYGRPPRAVAGSLSADTLARTIDYINDHLGDTLTLDAMADVAGLSVFHFSRTFARSTGHPPHRYVMIARVERAVALLRGSSLSLANIALRTGFADQSHMARLVRKLHGVTPKALRPPSATCSPAAEGGALAEFDY
jgi:AraC family transcriptional regulator